MYFVHYSCTRKYIEKKNSLKSVISDEKLVFRAKFIKKLARSFRPKVSTVNKCGYNYKQDLKR